MDGKRVEALVLKAVRSVYKDQSIEIGDPYVRVIIPVLKGPAAGGRRPVTDAERSAKRQFDIDAAKL